MAKKRQPEKTPTPLEALESLQKNGISAEVATKWCAEIRRERRASGIKMYERSKKAWAAVGRKY
jgi:hypothetical protein